MKQETLHLVKTTLLLSAIGTIAVFSALLFLVILFAFVTDHTALALASFPVLMFVSLFSILWLAKRFP